MNELVARLRAFWDGLSPRERWILGVALGLTAATLVYLGIAAPLVDSVAHSRERVEAGERNVALMRQWRRQLDEVNGRLAAVEQRIASGPRENLRTTLDRLRTQSGISKFDSIDEKTTKPSDRYRETQMEVVLKSVTLAQIVKYLHEIETTPQVLSVKSLRITRRADDPELLDVRFVVSTFEPV
ncbi:MAG: type II secretion system protein M [Deltaproteobacteria bacterium]|nr:MAG: type II secretion system protein M [Deltaproteobacteria bacterium]